MQHNRFNPSRLTLARRRRGLSKTALADQIDVDLRSVTGYEIGEYPPSLESLQKISSALDFPEDFFFGHDLYCPSPEQASFRALTKMSALQRDMALSEGALAILLNGWIEDQFQLPPLNLPEFDSNTSPADAASLLRAHWQLGERFVPNMLHMLEANGIRVFSLSINAKEVDAFSIWNGSTPLVFLNTYKTAEHSRFDAAHELGHLVLHKHSAPQGRQAEREADTFASEFLMPRRSVIAHAPKLANLNSLIKLKKVWNVSLAALVHRLHSLNLISDWHYRSLFIELSKKGYRSSEPDGSVRETSLLLPKVFSALREGGVSRSNIANAIGITNRELDQMIFGLVITMAKSSELSPSSASKVSGTKLKLVNK